MEYEVGKFYNIPCAKLINKGSFVFVPIIGVLHNDGAFGVFDKHYHIDGRFTKHWLWVDDNGKTNTIIGTELSDVNFVFVCIEIKRRKCIRELTGIKPSPRGYRGGITDKYWAWVDSMTGKSCKGKKCPHLGETMLERDGKLVCPLHNLIGDIKTEKIIST